MRIKGYFVVESDSISTLMNTVNMMMSEHPYWQPLSGIFVDNYRFYQTLVRY